MKGLSLNDRPIVCAAIKPHLGTAVRLVAAHRHCSLRGAARAENHIRYRHLATIPDFVITSRGVFAFSIAVMEDGEAVIGLMRVPPERCPRRGFPSGHLRCCNVAHRATCDERPRPAR
jgi:hypothetical protein